MSDNDNIMMFYALNHNVLVDLQEEVVEGGHSGNFKGKRYFTCEDGRGLILPHSRVERDDRFGPPTLKGGPTPAGEDVEKDKHMPSDYTQGPTSPKASGGASPLGSIVSPLKTSQKDVLSLVTAVESSDGDTANSKSTVETASFHFVIIATYASSYIDDRLELCMNYRSWKALFTKKGIDKIIHWL